MLPDFIHLVYDFISNVLCQPVMTRSALALDPSPSCTQPQSNALLFQCGRAMCHTVSHDLVLPYVSVCLHALTYVHVAPEGPCMLPCLHPLLAM